MIRPWRELWTTLESAGQRIGLAWREEKGGRGCGKMQEMQGSGWETRGHPLDVHGGLNQLYSGIWVPVTLPLVILGSMSASSQVNQYSPQCTLEMPRGLGLGCPRTKLGPCQLQIPCLPLPPPPPPLLPPSPPLPPWAPGSSPPQNLPDSWALQLPRPRGPSEVSGTAAVHDTADPGSCTLPPDSQACLLYPLPWLPDLPKI